jgi:hypothetical protein
MTIYNIIAFIGAAMVGAGFLLIVLLVGLMVFLEINDGHE